jgi:D-alanyl-D-alanine-carboxypeptidase/D-alanyl-D-alanine-endopeptidase
MVSHPKRLALLSVSLIVAMAATALQAADPPSEAELHQMLATRVDSQKLATGIVVGIVQASGTRIVSYGVMGLDDKRPVDGDTEFGVGSLTKVFTALVLSDMERHGRLSLSDPVGKYLATSRVTMPAFDGKPITLADLATQTSGFPIRPTNLVSGWAQQDEMGQMFLTQYQEYQGYTLADLYQFVSNFKLAQAPGTHYEYSNVNYALLGLVEAGRTGQRYGDLVRETITGPLSMSATQMQLPPSLRERLAKGYTAFYASSAQLRLNPWAPWTQPAPISPVRRTCLASSPPRSAWRGQTSSPSWTPCFR